MDVLAFILLITIYIWVVLPLTGASSVWNTVFTLGGISVAVISIWRKRVGRERAGLRWDNLLPALGVYLGSSLLYAGAVLFAYRNSLVSPPAVSLPIDRIAWGIVWAFLQQLCLLSFLLNRFRRILERDAPAVLAAAAIFAFFHLPNPFLTLYALGGGLIAASLFLRWPNLPAASLAHALASALVGRYLPREVTHFMRVGPLYWWTG